MLTANNKDNAINCVPTEFITILIEFQLSMILFHQLIIQFQMCQLQNFAEARFFMSD